MLSFRDYGIETDVVVLIVMALAIVLIVLIISMLVKHNRLKRRYEAFMKGQDGKSLEQSFISKFSNMDNLNSTIGEINEQLSKVDENLKITYQKMGIVKYDAFKEVGGTLSFVLAMLTKENDGFILNSMHSNREGCFTYIKEVKSGEVFVTLSDEESQALDEAKYGKRVK